jgi:hypothetical protein
MCLNFQKKIKGLWPQNKNPPWQKMPTQKKTTLPSLGTVASFGASSSVICPMFIGLEIGPLLKEKSVSG